MKFLAQVLLFMVFLAWATFYLIPLLEKVAVGYRANPHDCGRINQSVSCPGARSAPYSFERSPIWPD